MSDETRDERHDEATGSAFEREARRASARRGGALRELGYFLRRTHNGWLAPGVAALLPVSVPLVPSGTAVAPLIYALF
jgi:hypothetical protein